MEERELSENSKFTRRGFIKAGMVVITSAVLFNSLNSCTFKNTTTTDISIIKTSASSPPSGVVIPSSTPALSPVDSTRTLKMGLEAFLGSNVSLDWIHAVEVMVDHDNKNGGLDIGGTRYNIKLIVYESNSNQNTEVAAINKLVYEDNVKFIICEGSFAGGWLSVTDKEKVLVFSSTPPAQTSLIPKYNYSFNASFINPMTTVITVWYFNQHPEARNSYVMAYTDDMFGHIVAQSVASITKPFNITATDIFFPSNSTDLAALGTKVKTMNPMVFGCVTESDAQTGLVFKAVRDAGYIGQFINASIVSTSVLTQVMSPEAMEGLICGAIPSEFSPPLTKAAENFMELWIAKYGKWESPSITFCSPYSALKAALTQAGTIDTDKVAAILSSGLTFESPISAGMMISRPDLGNNRTIDSIATYYVKQIKDGKPNLITTIKMDEALKIFKIAYPPVSSNATTTS